MRSVAVRAPARAAAAGPEGPPPPPRYKRPLDGRGRRQRPRKIVRQTPPQHPPVLAVDHHHHVIVGVQIDSAVQCHFSLLGCLSEQRQCIHTSVNHSGGWPEEYQSNYSANRGESSPDAREILL